MAEIVDVAIVGGGAAGISAARRLMALKKSVLLIEALPRLGGRACTTIVNEMPLDLGCEWLHSAERNPLTVLADETGFSVDRRENAWRRHLENAKYQSADREQAWQAYENFGLALRNNEPASDRASDVHVPNDRWRPFIDALSSFINGVETDNLSVEDYLTYDDAASENNWRVKEGYGSLVASLGAGVPAALATLVNAVSEDGNVRIETSAGTVRSRAAIVSASTNVLASGRILFDAKVDEHLHAASRLPLGLADKVFLALSDPDTVPLGSHLLGRLDSAATASYFFRTFGRPTVECYLGGQFAAELEKAGEKAAVDFCVAQLRDLLGAKFAAGLSSLAVTKWGQEPTFLGSYSHASPGFADARATLARPVSDRLCFAGEACSPRDFSTAHGAWQSGIAAADWIAKGL